jgi:hypothetical protein
LNRFRNRSASTWRDSVYARSTSPSTSSIGIASSAGLSRMPAAAAWWARDRRTAQAVVSAIGQRRPVDLEHATNEILAAAKRTEVALSCHSAAMARAQSAVSRLNGKLAAAQQTGDLSFFDRAYKAYRLDCRARGDRPMGYNTALAKLRELLAGAAAGAPTADMLKQVFPPTA